MTEPVARDNATNGCVDDSTDADRASVAATAGATAGAYVQDDVVDVKGSASLSDVESILDLTKHDAGKDSDFMDVDTDSVHEVTVIKLAMSAESKEPAEMDQLVLTGATTLAHSSEEGKLVPSTASKG